MHLDGAKILERCQEGCYQKMVAAEDGSLVVQVLKHLGQGEVKVVQSYPIESVMAPQIIFKSDKGEAYTVHPSNRFWHMLSAAILEAAAGIEPHGLAELQRPAGSADGIARGYSNSGA